MDANVKIPMTLFRQTFELLDYIYMSRCEKFLDTDMCALLDLVLSAFLKKQLSISAHNDYSKLVKAETDDDRLRARVNYLKNKFYIQG